jgi:hypothetical protein
MERGDVLDMLFALHHEGKRPDWVALALRTMTGGLAAAQMAEGERARQQIVGDVETMNQS